MASVSNTTLPTIDGDIIQNAIKQITESILIPAFNGYVAVAKSDKGKLKFKHFKEGIQFDVKDIHIQAEAEKLSKFKNLTENPDGYDLFTAFVNANNIRKKRPELLELIEKANTVMICTKKPLKANDMRAMEKKLSQAMCIGCASEALKVYNALKKLSKNAVKQKHGMIENKKVLLIILTRKERKLINKLAGLLSNENSFVFVGLVGQTKLELQNEICNIALRRMNPDQMETAETDDKMPDTIMPNERYAKELGQLKVKAPKSTHKVKVCNGTTMYHQRMMEMMKNQGGRL